MEPLATDWAKKEAKMAKIIRYIHVCCCLCNIVLVRSIALKKCYLMMDFLKKVILHFLKYP